MESNVSASNRLAMLFDDGVYTELDSKSEGSVITACGKVYGVQCYAFSQDRTVDDGAMSCEQAVKILKVYDLAEKTGYPIVGIFDSLGAKVSQGLAALNGFSQLVAKANRLSGVVPQISVVSGVCAASSAIWAMCADVVVMNKEGELFVNPPSLVGDKKVGTAQTAIENGTAHIAADSDEEAFAEVRNILSMLPSNNLSVALQTEPAAPIGTLDTDSVVAIADADSVVELRKGFGSDTVTALARINGEAVGIVSAKETVNSDDCKKIMSLIALCDAFSIPVVTLVDVKGFEKSAEGEFDGIVKYASALTKAYAESTTVKVTLVTGDCYGPVYLAFAGNSDAVYAVDGAFVSAMRPDTEAVITNKDAVLEEGMDAAIVLCNPTAYHAAECGYIDDVIDAENTVETVSLALDRLASKRISTMDKKHAVLSY